MSIEISNHLAKAIVHQGSVDEAPHSFYRYDLRTVTRDKWGEATRWGQFGWRPHDAASFADPTKTAPLTLLINEDFKMLTDFRDGLLAKGLKEETIREKTTKYTAHIAYHLYQMYLYKGRVTEKKSTELPLAPTEDQMQCEIDRVAATLLRIM